MRRFPLYERHRPLSLSSPRCSWRDGDRFAVEPHAHHGDVELRQSIGIVHKKVLTLLRLILEPSAIFRPECLSPTRARPQGT
jgi:hypothetical protein